MTKNKPLSEKEKAVFDLLSSLIETDEDKKLAFTVMICCVDNNDLCDKILSFPDGRKHTSVSDINKVLGEFLEPIEIVDDED